jgi:uncharacterized protein YeeX (DUF496 family)
LAILEILVNRRKFMGVSMHITGLRDLDGRFATMLEIKKICEKAKVSYPKEVLDYFGSELIDYSEEYIKENMLNADIKSIVREYSDDYREGFEIAVADIPKEIKKIRFYVSC